MPLAYRYSLNVRHWLWFNCQTRTIRTSAWCSVHGTSVQLEMSMLISFEHCDASRRPTSPLMPVGSNLQRCIRAVDALAAQALLDADPPSRRLRMRIRLNVDDGDVRQALLVSEATSLFGAYSARSEAPPLKPGGESSPSWVPS